MTEDGTDRLSRNIGKVLPIYAVQFPRGAQILSTSHRKPEIWLHNVLDSEATIKTPMVLSEFFSSRLTLLSPCSQEIMIMIRLSVVTDSFGWIV